MNLDTLILELTYKTLVARAIEVFPNHEPVLRAVLLDEGFFEKVPFILEAKRDQTNEDKQYHNSIVGFLIRNVERHPSFAVIEIGCTWSFVSFHKYWQGLGYDSYMDYVHGILYDDGKGFDFYERYTEEKLPEDVTPEFVSDFFVGHVLRVLEKDHLLMALVWLRPESEGIRIFPPELLCLS